MEQHDDVIKWFMDQREKLDTWEIYTQLQAKCPPNSVYFSFDDDCGVDFGRLCGVSPVGRFRLWDSGFSIHFDVRKEDGSISSWHPENTQEALELALAFMEGTLVLE